MNRLRQRQQHNTINWWRSAEIRAHSWNVRSHMLLIKSLWDSEYPLLNRSYKPFRMKGGEVERVKGRTLSHIKNYNEERSKTVQIPLSFPFLNESHTVLVHGWVGISFPFSFQLFSCETQNLTPVSINPKLFWGIPHLDRTLDAYLKYVPVRHDLPPAETWKNQSRY